MYNTTKDYYNNTVTPAVEAAYSYVEPAVKTAYEKIEPAVQTAKTVVEPAVEKAKTIVEPAVEMAKSIVEPACESIKQYANQKMDNFKHQCSRTHPEGKVFVRVNESFVIIFVIRRLRVRGVSRNCKENGGGRTLVFYVKSSVMLFM
jgi:vacuolar-type H+-ATPase subunit H